MLPRRRTLNPIVRLICLAAALTTTIATLQARPAQAGPGGPEAAWARAREAGSYRFSADIVQRTLPLPLPSNAGREVKEDAVHIEGSTELTAQRMSLRLWSQGGSVLDAESGIEIQVDGDRALARQGNGPWEEIDNVVDWAAPNGDFLAFLAAAKNIQKDEGVQPSAFVFEIDGPRYAAYVRDLLEERLAAKGELPAGVALDLPQAYAAMTGEGELRIDANGLPLRQIVHVQFPDERDHRVEADITVDFSDYAFATGGIAPQSNGLAAWPRPVSSVVGLAAAAAFSLTIALYARSRRLRIAVSLVVIIALIVPPAVTSAQVEAFHLRQSERQNRLEEARAESDMARTLEALTERSDESEPSASDKLALIRGDSGSDQDGDGRSDVQEMLAGTNPLIKDSASLTALQAAISIDSDSDGLTDTEESLLGTDPLSADTDGDLVDDNLEVAGFTYNSRQWSGDPLEIDTNRDGIGDAQEWRFADSNWDLDGDGTPDLFDHDNDGDGVPDRLDLSPFTRVDKTFTPTDPFQLSITNLISEPTYVEFQVRPANPARLWYAFNVVDWPQGDTEGQVRDADGKTFYDVCAAQNPPGECSLTPDDNGDLKLVPMLEIEMATSAMYPRALFQDINAYGISRRFSADRQTATLLVPLHLVNDERTGQNVAFTGKFFFHGPNWGGTHKARLAWVLQALVDKTCVAYDAGNNCTQHQDNVAQPVHTYYEEGWTLTGLDIREDHGTNVGLIYEDPAVDPDLNKDDVLQSLAAGLDQSFLAGTTFSHTLNTRLYRDMQIFHIHSRFHHPNGGENEFDARRWDLPNILRVEKFSYAHLDEALANTVMTTTKQVLDANFTAAWSLSSSITPTILMAREEYFRATNLDDPNRSLSWSGNGLTIDLNGVDGNEVMTLASLKWTPYRYDGIAWQAMPIQDYWDEFERRHFPDIQARNPDSDVASGKMLVAQLLYLALYAGVDSIVEKGNRVLTRDWSEDDAAIAGAVGDGLNNGVGILAEFWDAGVPQATWRALGQLRTLRAGGSLASIKSTLKNGELYRLMRTPEFRTAVLVAVALLVVVTIVVLSAVLPDDVTGSLAFKITTAAVLGAVVVGLMIVRPILEAVRAARAVTTTATAVSKVSQAARFVKWLTKASTVFAIIGLVIDLGVTWGFFIAAWAKGDIKPGTIAFNHALTVTIVSTVLAVVLFAIGFIPVVGPIIVALIVIIDLILGIFDTSIAEVIAKLIHSGGPLVEMNSAGDIEPASHRPPKKLVVLSGADLETVGGPAGLADGARVRFVATVTTNAFHPVPEASDPGLTQADKIWSEATLRKNAFVYALTSSSAQTLSAPGLGSQAGSWRNVREWFTLIAIGGGTAHLRAGELTQAIASPTITLTQGLNRPLNLYFEMAYHVAAYECWGFIAYSCNVSPDGKVPSYPGSIAPDSLDIVIDVFPKTLDEFYALSWDSAFGAQADRDGDGLITSAAPFNGSDPDDTKADTDADGLSDRFELDLGTRGVRISPADADSDDDGLIDFQEVYAGDSFVVSESIRLGSDPGAADSDGDGLSDAQEIDGWTFDYGSGVTRVTSDPVRRDTDGDGLSDKGERDLHLGDSTRYPFHPRVANTGAFVGFESAFGTTHNGRPIVGPASTPYTTTLTPLLPPAYVARGTLTATLPAQVQLVSGPPTRTLAIPGGQRQVDAFLLRAATGAPSGPRSIANTIALAFDTNPLTAAQPVTAILPSLSEFVTVTVDTDRPTAGPSSVFGYFQPEVTRVIGGRASDPTSGVQKVEISSDGSTWQTASGRETWQMLWTAPTAEGAHMLFARATDVAGNVESPALVYNYTIDGTPPTVTYNLTPNAVISLTRDASGEFFVPLFGTSVDLVSGQERMFVEVTPNGRGRQALFPDVFDNWAISYTLATTDALQISDPTGAYTVTIESLDLVGNVRTITIPIRVDNREPIHAVTGGLPQTPVITQSIALTGRITETGPIIAGVANMEAVYFPADAGYSPGRWRALYFDNNSWRRPPADSTVVDDVNFNWGTGSPTPQVSADNFSALFERATTFRVAGTYRFTATHDADALVTATIDNVIVLSGGVVSNTVHVDAGVHALRVSYREGTDAASVAFGIERVEADWLPFATAQSGAGVVSSSWTYTVPAGLEGFYRLGLRGVDQIGNRNLQPFTWEVWRGEIDTAPPRAALEVYFTGFGSSAQTHYVVSIEDFNLTETGMTLPCGDPAGRGASSGAVDRFYYPTDWWREWFDDDTRLFQVTATCSRPGFATEPPEVSACDTYGHCAAIHAPLPANPNYRTVYWSDVSGATSRIARLNLENIASGVQTLVANAGVSNTLGLAVDAEDGYVYWTDRNAGLIRRANITDGLGITTILSGRSQPMGLALDGAGYMVWTEHTGGLFGTGSVMSATVTGSNVITLNQFNTGGPTGIALDTNAGWVYWANTTSGQYRLSRSNLDGSGFQGDIALPPDCNPAAGGIAIDGAASQLYWLDTECQSAVLGSNAGLYRATVPYGVIEYLGFTQPITIVNGLVLDLPAEKMYWTTTSAVMRAALNGTFSETVASGLTGAAGLALDANYAPLAPEKIAPVFQNTPTVIALPAYDPDGDALIYSITVSPTHGSLSGLAPNPTYTPALNYTGMDVFTYTVADGRGGLTAGRIDVDVLPAVGLDSAVFTPTHGTVITTSGAISVSGGAYALASLSALTVTADGIPIYTPTWPPSTIADTLWSTNWTPGEGLHTLNSVAADHAGRVQTDTHPIEVWVDLAAPSLTITPAVLTTTHLLPQPNTVAIGGAVSDAAGIDSVQVTANGGAFEPAAVSGSTWTLPWQAPFAIDNGAVLVSAEAADLAGRRQRVTDTLTIDIAPPAPVTVTLAYTNSLNARVPISTGVILTDTPIQLIVSWTPSIDGAGLGGYWAGWTTSETLNPASLTAKGVAATEHAQTPGEAQVLYAHLLIRDLNGNARTYTFGPVTVDSPQTPDLIADLNYRDWQNSGGSQVGADRRIERTGLRAIQKLYTSWDATALRLTWSGGNWDGDGDLFIYLDTTGGGATAAYNPYTITLPSLGLGAVAADYLLWVEDSSTARLMQWNGSSWVVAQTLSSANFQLALPYTDLLVPFAWLGIGNPGTATLRMAAFATEEDRLDLWAAMPNHNPLNSALVAHPLTATLAFSLTRHYAWTSLGSAIVPNAGQFVDEDVRVTIAPDPAGVAAGFLAGSLLDALPPGTPLDANLDGSIESALLAREGLLPIGAGRAVTYTVTYENFGSAIANGVTLTATAGGPLNFGGSSTKIITLPGVGAGVSGTLAFTTTVSGAGVSGEVDVVAAEPLHGPFEWWAIQHDVDAAPPISVTVLAPITTTRLMSDTAIGVAFDPSGVPTITLQVTTLPGNVVATSVCANSDPFGGGWTCNWSPGQTSGVTQVVLRAKATDGAGNVNPDWSAPVTLTVDTTPPVLTLDPAVETILAGGAINAEVAGTLTISATLTDNYHAARVELCATDGECDPFDVTPGNAPVGRWQYPFLSLPGGDGVTQTLTLFGVDGAGNRPLQPLTRTYVVDTVPPALRVTQALSQSGVVTLPATLPAVLAGTVSDGSGVSGVYVRMVTPSGQTTWLTATLNGVNWSFAPTVTRRGDHILSVEARDRAGNVTAFGPHALNVTGYTVYLPVIRRSFP